MTSGAWADADLNQVLSHVYFETEPINGIRIIEKDEITDLRWSVHGGGFRKE
jgi:hypothetical protein